MRSMNSFRVVAVAVLMFCVGAALPLQAVDEAAQGGVTAAIDHLLGRLPAKTAAEKEEIADEMLKLGEAGVRELCNRIRNRDEPLDGKVCSALFGMQHVARGDGNEKVRRMMAGVYAELLRGDASIASRRHIVRELRTLGREESIGPVAALLPVEELCEPAAQTLVAIGGAESAAALRQAAPKLEGGSRVTAVYALGRLRDPAAVELLVKEAGGADAAVRRAAVYALANIGDPAATAALLRAAGGENDEGAHARVSLLRFARRLAEGGRKKEAIEICREALAQAGPGDSGMAGGAFYQLMGFMEEEQALKEIAAGLGHESEAVRTAAVRMASDLRGEKVTLQLAAALPGLKAPYRARLLDYLRWRGDPAALPAALGALEDKDEEVRIASIGAIGSLGKRDTVPKLLAFLDGTPEESKAARSALTGMGDNKLGEALEAALPRASSPVRCALLEVLAARDIKKHIGALLAGMQDEDEAVRRTALKILGTVDDSKVVAALMKLLAGTESADGRGLVEPALLGACRRLSKGAHRETAESLIGEYADADAPVRCALVRAVACLAEGYPAGLAHVRSARGDAEEAVREAALRALAEWPNPDPMEDLLKIAADSEDMTENVVALRGCVRMAKQCAASGKQEDITRALAAYGSVLAAARRPEEKKEVLGALSAIKRPGALESAVSCLDDAAVRAEAAAAAVKIGAAIHESHAALVASAMQAVLKTVEDKALRRQAEELAGRVEAKAIKEQDMPVVFKADFEDGKLDRWEPTDGKAWRIEKTTEGKALGLVAKSNYIPPVRSPHSINLVKGVEVGDFVLNVRMRSTNRDYGHRDLCLIFGYRDSSHFYYAHLANKADAHANSIFLVDGAPRVSIAEKRTNGTPWDDKWHNVRIVREAESGSIRVYFDDMEKPAMEANDKHFTRGRVGVGSFDDTGLFDDLVLRALDPAAGRAAEDGQRAEVISAEDFAGSLEGPYVHRKEPVTDMSVQLEDGYFFTQADGRVYMLSRDYGGRFGSGAGGSVWVSDDGVHSPADNVKRAFESLRHYAGKDAVKGGGDSLERPQLLELDGRVAYMYLASRVNLSGEQGSCSYVFRLK